MEPELSVMGKVILLFAGVGFLFGLFVVSPKPSIINGLGFAFMGGLIAIIIMNVLAGIGILLFK